MEVYPMRKIDNWVIEQFDKGTTLLQKKGWLPLNTLIMGTECLFWVSLLSIQDFKTGFAYLATAWTAISLSVSFHTWKENANYWENHRKTLALNAEVLLVREAWHLRLTLNIPIFILLIFFIIIFDLKAIIFDSAAICLQYLACCRYMGPGDYARERQTKMSGLPQEG